MTDSNISQSAHKDTSAWVFQVWASFAFAMTATVAGIVYLPLDPWHRGYLALAFIYVVGASFTLAKTIRDNHEAGKLLNRIKDAKAERLIRNYENAGDL